MTMRSIHILLLATQLLVSACGGKAKPSAYSDEELLNNPAANFQAGLNALTPDKKTNAVDYATAYDRFNASANLGGGPKAHFNAGWVAEQLDKPAEAEEHYRKAYEADPTYEQAMFSLARVLNAQGSPPRRSRSTGPTPARTPRTTRRATTSSRP
jgi:tetratricopeptide (TPR) repeat protein